MKTFVFLLAALLSAAAARAGDTIPAGPFHYIDSVAAHAPDTLTPEPKYIAAYLKKYCETDMDRARAAYTWTAAHITYDADAFNAGRKTDQSCEHVMKCHKAVCQGYANTYQMLCTYLGLEAVVIRGHSKGYGYEEGDKFEGKKPGHAWNAVRVDSRWLLIDATWGSGYGRKVDGKLEHHRRFDTYYFDTDPYAFAFAHYPLDTQWLLVPQRISLRKFEEMPLARAGLFKFGFSGRELYEKYLSGTLPEKLPTVYYTPHKMTLSGFPESAVIKVGTHLDLIVECEDDVTIVAVAEKGAHPVPFTHVGHTYTLSAPTMRGDLKIGVGTLKKHSWVIAYTVK